MNTVRSKEALSKAIGVPEELITKRAFGKNQASLYFSSVHRKRSGGTRVIHAPHWPLRNIQKQLLRLLEEIYRPSSRVMGFVKGRGIRENARLHVGKRLILNIDLEDYFPSIHVGRVRGRLMAEPYNLTNDVATTIAKLCTLDGFLPIGAPTSPMLANIVTSSLDGKLSQLARDNGCFFTRYADDITFSTNKRSFPQSMVANSDRRAGHVELGDALGNLIASCGFKVNNGKVRLLDKGMRQEVCGITCNERLNPNRRILREVRAVLHAWKKFGRDNASDMWKAKFNWRGASSLERSLRGKIEYIAHVRGENDVTVAALVQRFNELPGRIYKNIEYNFVADRKEAIKNSICLIESGCDEAMDWRQGSGFVVDNGLVLTNYHNIANGDGVYPKIESVFVYQSGVRHNMNVVFSDPARDIALLSVKEVAWKSFFEGLSCQLSFADVALGTKVYVGGFPSYTIGDSCTVYDGTVVGTSTLDGQRYFKVSQPIVKGNSGGPVFDERGQVVGIATRGIDTHDVANLAFNGCIPLHTIDRVLLAAVK